MTFLLPFILFVLVTPDPLTAFLLALMAAGWWDVLVVGEPMPEIADGVMVMRPAGGWNR